MKTRSLVRDDHDRLTSRIACSFGALALMLALVNAAPARLTLNEPKLRLAATLTSQQTCRDRYQTQTAFMDILTFSLEYTNVGTDVVTVFQSSDYIGSYSVLESPEDFGKGIRGWEMNSDRFAPGPPGKPVLVQPGGALTSKKNTFLNVSLARDHEGVAPGVHYLQLDVSVRALVGDQRRGPRDGELGRFGMRPEFPVKIDVPSKVTASKCPSIDH